MCTMPRENTVTLIDAFLISIGAGVLGVATAVLVVSLTAGISFWSPFPREEVLLLLFFAFALPFGVTLKFTLMMVYQQYKQ